MFRGLVFALALLQSVNVIAYSTQSSSRSTLTASASNSLAPSRRAFLKTASATAASFIASSSIAPVPANAVGPVKLKLAVKSYSAKICPPDRPIPVSVFLFSQHHNTFQ